MAKAWAQIKWEEDEANYISRANNYSSRRNDRVDRRSNDRGQNHIRLEIEGLDKMKAQATVDHTKGPTREQVDQEQRYLNII